MNGSSATEGVIPGSPSDTIPAAAAPQPVTKPSLPGSSPVPNGGNAVAKPSTSGTPSSPAPNNGNGSPGFNQQRNEFRTAVHRVTTAKKQAIGEVVEWASGGSFEYGDIGRMTEGDTPKLRAATELMASAVAGRTR